MLTLKKEKTDFWRFMMKYATYLFDFDGTLVDSMPTYSAAMIKLLDDNNIKYEKDIMKIITPLGYRGAAEYFARIGLDMPIEEMMRHMREFALYEYSNNIPAKENVVEVLKELHKSGADMNVLTASPHIMLDVCLKRLGIYDLFNNVWSCDDFNTTKADPEIYIKAAEKIGKPIDEILFLDDNYNADKTAKSVGMKVCGVFDKSSAEYEEEIKSVSDEYIYNFKELLEL